MDNVVIPSLQGNVAAAPPAIPNMFVIDLLIIPPPQGRKTGGDGSLEQRQKIQMMKVPMYTICIRMVQVSCNHSVIDNPAPPPKT